MIYGTERGDLWQTVEVVRTGARAEVLKDLLVRGGFRVAGAVPAPRIESLSIDLAPEVAALYNALGGRAEVLPTARPGAWDLMFEPAVVVELDEELHFNRYRQLTLDADWSSPLPWRDDYLRLCRQRETNCLAAGKWGKRWTNASCEAMFGVADSPGVFETGGAPRWKQRALYDSIKDAVALSGSGIRLARISTHDVVDGVALGAILEHRATCDLDALVALVEERTT